MDKISLEDQSNVIYEISCINKRKFEQRIQEHTRSNVIVRKTKLRTIAEAIIIKNLEQAFRINFLRFGYQLYERSSYFYLDLKNVS